MVLKRIIKRCLAKFGYRITRIPSDRDERWGYTLYKFVRTDGSFDFEKYRQIQILGNQNKIGQVWVSEKNISFLSDYIKRTVGQPQFGICHGTRRGKEQEWFRKYLGCEVIGTEISPTAEQFPNTIQWDFHEVKPEWIEACDFIYSNALDHSYDPQKCLNAWMSCVKKTGVCILEHSSDHRASATSARDPFGADIVIMPYLISTWAEGNYAVREIIDAPVRNIKHPFSKFIVIQRI